MTVPEFGNLRSDAGLEKLNAYLAPRSYISGYTATQDDVATAAKMLGAPSAAKLPHAFRWYKHITSFHQNEQASWPKGSLKQEAKQQDDDDFDLFGDDDEAELEKLKAKKKEETAGKKKKEVINKSSLVIEVKPASADSDLDEIVRLAKDITMEGLTWGEAVKKVPVAFGLYKLQLSCVILDDLVNTTEITDQLEALGMNEEQKEQLRKRQEGEEEEEDEDEEPEGLVQSAEIVSFNKL
ncbi:elongation factor 1-beta [Cyclospora cayetanensis]|uniref:Elongation factor 1-beta n=1 Tax=Cyclospora cayetanensis TaxID=88456 RepID=A0A6P6RWY4_9EIME|nr:elongation factor 1-beta [Cyclospora cayetanensis]